MSNFKGYLLKFNHATKGEYIVPSRFIEASSFKGVFHTQDVEAGMDTTGLLHRDVAENGRLTVDFTLPATTDTKVQEGFFAPLRARYSPAKEKKVNVTAWVAEYGKYITEDVYLQSSFEPVIETIEDDEVNYTDMNISFVGYGGKP